MRRITEGDARSLDCSLFRLLYYGPGVLRDVARLGSELQGLLVLVLNLGTAPPPPVTVG